MGERVKGCVVARVCDSRGVLAGLMVVGEGGGVKRVCQGKRVEVESVVIERVCGKGWLNGYVRGCRIGYVRGCDRM